VSINAPVTSDQRGAISEYEENLTRFFLQTTTQSNPLSTLMVGIIATVLLQSSTAAVAIVVALEEAGVMTVQAGIYMVCGHHPIACAENSPTHNFCRLITLQIMGANIGTTITSALVTLGQLRDMGELERGVAAAAVHSLFNFLTVAVLFPVELAFGYLQAVSRVLVNTAETGGKEDAYVGPIKRIVHPLVDVIITSNSKLITGVARGKKCEDFHPIECDPTLIQAINL
jgi:solute carrier family 34 (sodium-dependent phosphate cotransporter)